MPIPVARVDVSNQLVPFTTEDVTAFGLQSRGIRDGSGYQRKLRMGSTTRQLKWLMETYNRSSSTFWDCMVYLIGAATLYTNGSGKKRLSRIMPWTDPEETRLAVTEVNGRGFRFVEDEDRAAPLPTFDSIDLDCLAELLPFDLKPDGDITSETERYVERLPDQQTAQYLSLPGISAGLRLKKDDGTGPDGTAGGSAVNYNVGIPYLKGKIGRKWWRVPREAVDPGSPLQKRWTGDPDNVDVAKRLSYVNSCNKTTFLGYPPGQLVMLAPEVQPMYDPVASDWVANITYWFDWIPNGGRGANYLYWHQANPGWYLATRGAYAAPGAWNDADVLFPAREFEDLFVPGEL